LQIRQALARAWPDLVAGSIFALIGLVFVVQSLQYELGTLFRMGAGLFPLILAIALTGLGIGVMASGFVAEREEALNAFPWRAMILVPAAFIVFALTARPLGLVPALFASTILAGFASPNSKPVTVVVTAAGLTVLALLVFVVGLQLRLSLFGSWLGI
jgi:hypothetical protein